MHKPLTYALLGWVAVCIATQMNYLNKALDTFNTTMVSSVYYVFFTLCTVTASMIMYKYWENENAGHIVLQLLSLVILLLGVHTLSSTRDSKPGWRAGLSMVLGRSELRKAHYELCSTVEEDGLEEEDLEGDLDDDASEARPRYVTSTSPLLR